MKHGKNGGIIFIFPWLTCAKRREFSGMIHWLTINVIIPATPSNPSIPYAKRTSKMIRPIIFSMSPRFPHDFPTRDQPQCRGVPQQLRQQGFGCLQGELRGARQGLERKKWCYGWLNCNNMWICGVYVINYGKLFW